MTVPEEQARSLFLAALEREPAQWPAFLDEACRGDAALRARVEQLLHAHQALGSIHGERAAPAGATAAEQSPPETPGTVIGPYQLLELLGEGGMGAVWKAQQTEPVRRLVAVKLIKSGMDSAQVVARFEAERQALALMDHPNIARVLDGGQTPPAHAGGSPRPYFVMDLVQGIPITRYCDEQRLTPRQRLELFVPVCQAIQHAHQKGVIHRDIKPSNVLVALYDGQPVPKVIDFGVAKATGQPLTEQSLHTGFGTILGTLEYMSPEQTEFNQLDIDTRSDIYALGVLLYELLTGSPPFTRKELERAGLLELLRVIREEEPSKPSTRLSTSESLPTLAANRGTEPARLTRLVRGELDWIVMKALEKDRKRRYETARDLALDVQRYLADEPVQAGPPSATYRLRKFARRNKMALGITGLTVSLFVMLGSGAGWILQERRTQREAAESMVREALALAEPRLREGNPRAPDLVTALHRAEAQVARGMTHPELLQQVDQLRADLDILVKLESIPVGIAARVKDGGHDHAWADAAYAHAFRDYGIDLDVLSPQEAVARIQSKVIFVQLAAALDDWAPYRRENRAGDDGSWKRLLAVAREADPDPWRQQLRDVLASRDPKGAEPLAATAPIDTLPATTLSLLGMILRQSSAESAVGFLRQAQRRYPADFWINHQLGLALQGGPSPQLEEAIGFHRAALAARPESPPGHFTLGAALTANNKPEEAIAQYKEALRLKPDYPEAHYNLGNVLSRKPGGLDDAITAFREAIRHNLPNPADAHYNLGNALIRQKRVSEAIDAYREAIRLRPDFDKPYFNLGNVLRDEKRLDEAVTAFNQAIERRPTPEAYTNLGTVLGRQGKLEEAIRAFKKAIVLKPDHVTAHSNLGYALEQQGQAKAALEAYREVVKLLPKSPNARLKLADTLERNGKPDEALVEYRETLRLKPDMADARYNLAGILADKGKVDEAIFEYREVVRFHPDFAEAHCNLGKYLQFKGQFAEALAARRRGHDLGSKQPGWQYPSAKWVQEAERLVELDHMLLKILDGKARPSGAQERIELAWMCHQYKRLSVAATRFYEEAFDAEPQWADNAKTTHRYNAACAAALAGCGQSQDAKALDDQKRSRLRRQSLEWLRADLAGWAKELNAAGDKGRATVRQKIQHWLQDTDLAGVRDPDGLAKLPEAERQEWHKLWEEAKAMAQGAAQSK